MSDAGKTYPWGKGVRVLERHACGLIAVEKPEGVLAHPNEQGGGKCLVNAPYDAKEEAYVLGEGIRLHLLHRLDSPTSGVILLAENAEVAALVREVFRANRVNKTYVAVVSGIVRRREGVWKDALDTRKRGGGKGAHVRSRTGAGQEAVTGFKFLPGGRGSRLQLVELYPETGRTHQLRVHCAAHNYPVLGDKTYGDFKLNENVRRVWGLRRLCLHAREVSLKFEYKSSPVNFSAHAPMPKVFEQVLTQRG